MDLPPEPGAGPETTGTAAERHEREPQDEPRIYVASLSDYNDGILHGVWIDAAQDPDVLLYEIDNMLATSPSGKAEEFAVHDYEGFGDYSVGEYDSLRWVSRVARGIRDHGLAFGAWAGRCENDEDMLEQFQDAYLGDWASTEDYADDLLDSFGLQNELDAHVPEGLHPYVTIDVTGFARDLELGGDITAVEHKTGVWIFDATL